MNETVENKESMQTEALEKSLIAVTATITSINSEENHEIIMLAKDDEEIKEKLVQWLKCTHRGSHLLSWEKGGRKGLRKREGNENKSDRRRWA